MKRFNKKPRCKSLRVCLRGKTGTQTMAPEDKKILMKLECRIGEGNTFSFSRADIAFQRYVVQISHFKECVVCFCQRNVQYPPPGNHRQN
mmetsp:Transcript_196/g.317  ORF Transcript_196/g.317 Transcript_196/m.317 type:complete len:90 (-) Transcript_196:256-525(-)